jgi:hypothetical protein
MTQSVGRAMADWTATLNGTAVGFRGVGIMQSYPEVVVVNVATTTSVYVVLQYVCAVVFGCASDCLLCVCI